MKTIQTGNIITEGDLASLSAFERECMYNGLDCCVTLEILEELLKQADEPARFIYQRSLDLRAPILEMSMRGIRVDEARRQAVLQEFTQKRDFVRDRLNWLVQDVFGLSINYRSDKDIKHLLYDILEIRPVRKKNANGQFVPTVNRDALEKLQVHFWAQPIISHLLLLRDFDKKLQFLQTGIDPDGRMRATFNIAGTNTGRLASSESEFGTGTNQQNVDRSLRSIFIPDPGKKFINIDLEQGDSRNLGALMWEVFVEDHGEAFAGAYLSACESGDLHTTVCQMAWHDLAWPAPGSPLIEFKKVAEQLFYRQDTYRQMAKKLGHGTNFMGQPPTMAMHTKTPVSIIQEFQRRYFSAFPSIPAYHKWVEQQIRDYASLTTLHGRRRFFFGRADDPATIRDAVAFGAQSMTADAVNRAMIDIWRDYTASGRLAPYGVELLCQVHDSLLFQVNEDSCDECVPIILELGRAPLTLKKGREFCVPNEAKIGWNWGDFDKSEPNKNPFGLIKWSSNGDSRVFEKKPLTLIGR